MCKAALCLLLAGSAAYAAGLGETLFQTNCAPCHGAKGDGGRGSNLAVRKLPRAPDDAALAAIVAQGIPGTQMPATRMTPAESTALIAYVRGLAKTQPAQAPGDPSNGESIFHSKGNCSECHTVNGHGGHADPDLTEIGAKRSPANLRTSLLDPQAEVPENFSAYRKWITMPDNYLRIRAVTRDGIQVLGQRVDEDTFTIQIRDDSDRLHSFRKDELRELDKQWGKSPMPSYQKLLSEAELRDVIAYLSSLQGAQ
jgi:putative heme-binding domain-containing protein